MESGKEKLGIGNGEWETRNGKQGPRNGNGQREMRMDTMIRELIVVLLVMLVVSSLSRAQEAIALWPAGKMPNSKGMALKEIEENQRITQVGTPRIEVFLPAPEDSKHSAVIVIPGGGYHHLTRNWGGEQLAKWFNTMGVAAFVLIHRLPTCPDLVHRELAPVQDAQRAMRIVRAHASRWGILPDRIGVMGTSAGGHLASCLGTFEQDCSAVGDSLDAVPFRPDFMMLVSPVIDLGPYAHAGSRDNLLGKDASAALISQFSTQNRVTVATPPAFIVHAANDKAVPMLNSLLFHRALVEHGVMASLHIFPSGGHSIALRNNPGSTAYWTMLAESWMKEMGFIADGRSSQ
jgi:acetyl esterase/lipase